MTIPYRNMTIGELYSQALSDDNELALEILLRMDDIEEDNESLEEKWQEGYDEGWEECRDACIMAVRSV